MKFAPRRNNYHHYNNVKPKLIRSYLGSTKSIRTLSKQYSVPPSLIAKWLKNTKPVYFNYIHNR